jgi:hypothetical protein
MVGPVRVEMVRVEDRLMPSLTELITRGTLLQ